jgi:putative metallohydrolase (TIGR04338 family)
MGRPRDSQRSRLYKAEHIIRYSGRGFDSIDEIQEYTNKLLNSAWFKKRFTAKRIFVAKGRHDTSAWANSHTREISMPTWTWGSEAVVLHEIAHILCDDKHGSDKVSGHGREYARILVELVDHCMGKDCGKVLRDSFKKHGVKYSLPRKPMTPEQRAAAVERMAVARANRGVDKPSIPVLQLVS